jgi:hypothetical protein
MAGESTGAARHAAGTERRFGLTVGGVFLALGLFFLWRDHATAGTVLAALGGTLVLGGLFVPRWLGPVERGWMAVAEILGAFWARVILGFAYYVVFTPVGLIMRLAGRDPLDRRLRSDESYWKKRPTEPPPSRERYARQY